MKLQLHPLGISLLIHIVTMALFLFWLTSDRQKTVCEPLKIKLVSFSSPAVTVQSAPAPKLACSCMKPMQKSIVKPSIKVPTPPPKILPSPSATPSTPVAIPIKAEIPKTAQQTLSAETPKPTVIAAPPPPPPVNVEKEFLNAHLGEIRTLLLQNFKYPKMAQKLKMQGEVRVVFSLGANGSVENLQVTESSGFEILDEDAMALITKTAPSFPKPTKSVRISVPLSYVLH